jgi:D-glycero-D-manno-heptose 1,7-bisphosphate phosphatase
VIAHPLPGKRLLIFDADGTLRRCTVPGQPCPNTAEEWEVMPRVKETLALYPPTVRMHIISNQGGVGLGYLSRVDAERLLYSLACISGFRGKHLFNMVVSLCPHAPQAGCPCRKPSPYLLLRAIVVHNRDLPMGLEYALTDVLYVGDQDTDRECATRAGVDFLWAQEFFGWTHT